MSRIQQESGVRCQVSDAARRAGGCHRFIGASVAALAVFLASCETAPRQTPSSAGAGGIGGSARQFEPVGIADMIDRSAHVRVTNTVVRAEVMRLATVPYDNMSVPLVSPDGLYLATQTNVSPTWPTLLAEHEAQVPWATRIEIYRLPLDGEAGSSAGASSQFVAQLAEPAILGRSFDDRGFLIESPREDGSRWIGHAKWESGHIEWLVADDRVNAFPSLGPEGRLAWSRRAVDAENGRHFELVVRSPSTQSSDPREWAHASVDECWLLPTWSNRGDRLFVASLRGEQLSAVHAVASDERTFMQSRMYLPLASNADVFTAYQTIGAHAAGGFTLKGAEQLVLFHPAAMRMAVWRPHPARSVAGAGGRGLIMLQPNSLAAVIDEHDRAMVTLDRHLVAQRLELHADVAVVMAGTQIVRATRSANWPYVLLEPGDSVVGVVAFRPGASDSLARR